MRDTPSGASVDEPVTSQSLTDRFAALHADDALAAKALASSLGRTAQASGARVVAVSACLLGEPTRYDGGDKRCQLLMDSLLADADTVILPLCPERLAGMGCPRPAVHYAEGDGATMLAGRPTKAVTATGEDCTALLDQGAARAERLIELAGAAAVVLKERSPSCGVRQIHGANGLQAGLGMLTARLQRHGLTIQCEEEVLGESLS